MEENQKSSSTRQLDQSWSQGKGRTAKEQLKSHKLQEVRGNVHSETKYHAAVPEYNLPSLTEYGWKNRTATASNIRCIIEATTTIGPGRRNEQIATFTSSYGAKYVRRGRDGWVETWKSVQLQVSEDERVLECGYALRHLVGWDPLMSLLGRNNLGSMFVNFEPYHLELVDCACRTVGMNGTKTVLFALPTFLNVDPDARTHNHLMVLPHVPHRMRSMSIHSQHPSQQDAKVQNRHK